MYVCMYVCMPVCHWRFRVVGAPGNILQECQFIKQKFNQGKTSTRSEFQFQLQQFTPYGDTTGFGPCYRQL
jgi:hypothetical protein